MGKYLSSFISWLRQLCCHSGMGAQLADSTLSTPALASFSSLSSFASSWYFPRSAPKSSIGSWTLRSAKINTKPSQFHLQTHSQVLPSITSVMWPAPSTPQWLSSACLSRSPLLFQFCSCNPLFISTKELWEIATKQNLPMASHCSQHRPCSLSAFTRPALPSVAPVISLCPSQTGHLPAQAAAFPRRASVLSTDTASYICLRDHRDWSSLFSAWISGPPASDFGQPSSIIMESGK